MRTDEILAIAFGDIDEGTATVMVDFRVRVEEPNGTIAEGTRGNVLMHYTLLQSLQAQMPAMLQYMKDAGADHDAIAPAKGPLPHWNSGPTIERADSLYFCTSFAISGVEPDLGAFRAIIGTRQPGQAAPDEGEYLLPHRVMVILAESLPKVLRKMDQRGATGT